MNQLISWPAYIVGAKTLLVAILLTTTLTASTCQPTTAHPPVTTALASTSPADVPGSHEKALNHMLRGFQRDLTKLIPAVIEDSASRRAGELVQVYFVADTVAVLNHITPANIKPGKPLEALADKPMLTINEFLTLAAGLYRADFRYQLDRDELAISALDTATAGQRQVYRYRLTVPVLATGRLNPQVQLEARDTLAIFALVYTDSNGKVLATRMQNMLRNGTTFVPPAPAPVGPTPVPPQPNDTTTTTPVAMIDWTPGHKTEIALAYANALANETTDAQFARIKAEYDVLFDPSGFVTVTTKDGKEQRLERQVFLAQARQSKKSYTLDAVTLVKFDQFRQNAQGKRFCRITTYHDVKQFAEQMPVPGLVTSAGQMPVVDPPASPAYWQIRNYTGCSLII